MTHAEQIMLAISFGAVLGTFIGNLITLIKFAIKDHKEKKAKRLEEAKKASE